ncbi:unnamed protein product [Rhizophagus irregularis]|nr:unnamed protein product [Rhizophagus irregularis]
MTVITQEMGLKTEKQMRTYEKIIREIQNFMMNIIYENYEQRFERKMSETSIGDNNENVKNHNNGNTRDDNDIIMENNEGNNIENVEEQRNDE